MIEFENTAIVITARMAAPGLPGRPMLDVNGRPLVLRAWANAVAANLGPVLVATADSLVAEAVRAAGGDALVVPQRLSGVADQAAAAIALRDGQRQFHHVMGLPCQFPLVEALSLRRCLAGLMNEQVEIATLACRAAPGEAGRIIAPLEGEREVAYLRGFAGPGENAPFRQIPIYAFRRAALEHFASLPPGLRKDAPEAQRALDAGMKLAAVKVDTAPLSVDTPQELEALRRLLKA
ncbi:MAG: hypothetical protein KGO53_04535 [Alphaproteobacteria bacterium]|nr:hypothetical protein [Alphaproteobacteria bacterium]